MPSPETDSIPLQEETIQLKNGERLHLRSFRYPIDPGLRARTIGLIQTQWPRTDIDWLQTMRGEWSETLEIRLALASISGEEVGTAQVAWAVDNPEVNIVMDVMVREDGRGKGIGSVMTDWLQNQAFAAGSKVAYLGNRPGDSVYEKIGFVRLGGVFMRKPAVEGTNPEEKFFRKSQETGAIRPAVPGDMPSIVCLNAQQHETAVLNYEHGIISRKYEPPLRAVSSFSRQWDSVRSRDGHFLVLEGDRPHRILAYGTLEPGPAPVLNHCARLDFTFQSGFAVECGTLIQRLIECAAKNKIERLHATVCDRDSAKRALLQQHGFAIDGRSPCPIRLGGSFWPASELSKRPG